MPIRDKSARTHSGPLDSERERLSTLGLELTDEERALLSDPEWMDEDEADFITAMRIGKEEEGRAIPLRQWMSERGLGGGECDSPLWSIESPWRNRNRRCRAAVRGVSRRGAGAPEFCK